MADTKTLIEQAYSAFNKRDIDGALALMTQDVSWPKASEGGKVVGKEEIRAYWTRQWGEFDPHVEPLAITEGDGGKVRVRVHQLGCQYCAVDSMTTSSTCCSSSHWLSKRNCSGLLPYCRRTNWYSPCTSTSATTTASIFL